MDKLCAQRVPFMPSNVDTARAVSAGVGIDRPTERDLKARGGEGGRSGFLAKDLACTRPAEQVVKTATRFTTSANPHGHRREARFPPVSLFFRTCDACRG